MNNPWTDPNWKTIDFTNHRFFKGLVNDSTIQIKESTKVFAGSCDISGVKHARYWHEIYCESAGLDHDSFVYIGNSVYTLSSILRKLYSYLNIIETPPTELLLVAPVSTHEHIVNGTCYSINDKLAPMDFLYRSRLIPQEDIDEISKLQQAFEINNSREQQIYNFCREFSFLEMICKNYNIKLRWTPNLTWNALQFYRNIDELLDSHSFAKKTFIGYDPKFEIDKTYDSPTASSHEKIAALFLNSSVNG